MTLSVQPRVNYRQPISRGLIGYWWPSARKNQQAYNLVPAASDTVDLNASYWAIDQTHGHGWVWDERGSAFAKIADFGVNAGNATNTSFTMACWVQPNVDGLGTVAEMVMTLSANSSGVSSGSPYISFGRRSGNGGLAIQVDRGSPSAELADGDGSGVSGWTHVSLTFDHQANHLILYKNGHEHTTLSPLGPWGSNALRYLFVGWSSGFQWKGQIDTPLLYNRCLRPNEIRTLCQNQLLPITHVAPTAIHEQVATGVSFQPAWAANATVLVGSTA